MIDRQSVEASGVWEKYLDLDAKAKTDKAVRKEMSKSTGDLTIAVKTSSSVTSAVLDVET